MWERLRLWLDDIPCVDSLARRQATIIQLIELGLLGSALAMIPFPLLLPAPLGGRIVMMALVTALALANLGALLLLRRGRVQASATAISVPMVVILSLMIYVSAPEGFVAPTLAFSLPIALSGLVSGRRGLVLLVVLSIVGMSLAMFLNRLGLPGAGFVAPEGDTTALTAISCALLVMILALLVASLGGLLRDALTALRTRERELETFSRGMEVAVRERTADLEMALAALEQRTSAQQRLLDENRRQRELIRALGVPVLPLDRRTVVLPLVGEMDDERLATVENQALGAVERFAARRLLLDITGVTLVDTNVARCLLRTLGAARLLGAEVALVGVRPEVAQAIVGLGVDLDALRSFADLQSALA